MSVENCDLASRLNHLADSGAVEPQPRLDETNPSSGDNHAQRDLTLALAESDTLEGSQVIETLCASEQLYRHILETCPESVVVCDMEGTIVQCNQQTLRLHGYEREQELIGKHMHVLVAPEHALVLEGCIRELLEQGTHAARSIRLLRKDGTHFAAEGFGSLITGRNSHPKGIVWMARDITDRQRFEMEHSWLEEQNKAFSSLGYKLSAARTSREAALCIAEVADALLGWDACTLCFYSAEEERMHSLLMMDFVDGARSEIAQHSPKGFPPTELMRRTMSEGPQMLLRASSEDTRATGLMPFGSAQRSRALLFVPIRSGNCTVGVLSVQSYTPEAYTREDLETLQALADHCGGALERTLAEYARTRLVAAVEAAGDRILIHDNARQIQYVNSAFERITGFSREESVGKHPRELLHVDSGQNLMPDVEESLAQGASWSGQVRSKRKDGQPLHEKVTVSAMQEFDGSTCGYVAVRRDITREMAMEAELLHAQKMQAMGHLAGRMAHDFNNLLQIILGYAQSALRTLPQDNSARGVFEKIQAATKRGGGLTRELLAFSRKQQLRPESLDLNQFICNMENMITQLVGSDVELITVLDPFLGIIHADPGQMEMALINLVINARDAMPNGGTLTLRTHSVELGKEPSGKALCCPQGLAPGAYVQLVISDTGTGMDEETCSRIFEPFFTTKASGKGTGLGLSTVYGVIAQSGGHIRVNSERGKGSSFTIHLPSIEPDSTPEKDKPAKSFIKRGSETILLVEDEAEVRRPMRLLLEDLGYKVLEAGNGAEALKAAEVHTGPVHLLLTDLEMPSMGGRELHQRLSAVCKDLRTIFISGYLGTASLHEPQVESKTDWLQKPFSEEVLARKIRELLDRQT